MSRELLKILDKKSERPPIIFAEEIKELEADKILFLMFPFISSSFSEIFVKSNYEAILE
jgi:hypothetical protein